MCAGALVIVDIRGKDTAQMALIEDHYVIQTFTANRTDHALDVRVLPRRAWRRDDFRDVHRFDSAAKLRAIRCVAVSQQIPRSSVPRERLGYLAREPRCGRMLGDSRAHDLPATMGQNDHYVEQPKRRGVSLRRARSFAS